jgi:hypothetical protein
VGGRQHGAPVAAAPDHGEAAEELIRDEKQRRLLRSPLTKLLTVVFCLSTGMAEGKTHVSIVICGHVDAGKSTTTGRLIYELGGIPEREMEKLRAEADALGKGSFCFAFFMDVKMLCPLFLGFLGIGF